MANDSPELNGRAELVGYFGYGSLVNRLTLRSDIVAAFPARLNGWRRGWRPRPVMEPDTVPGAALMGGLTPSLLSAHPDPGAAIDGLLVIDFLANLPEIDTREFRYHRRDITLDALELDRGMIAETTGFTLDPGLRLHVYESRTEHPPADGPSPILRSYLDAVLQGFLREFGAGGVHRFVTETDAFHTPIHEDRHAPLYPRAVTLSQAEAELFDHALARRAMASVN